MTQQRKDSTATRIDLKAQRANATAEEDNQSPIKKVDATSEGGEPQIMVDGVSSPEGNQALVMAKVQPQIMVNGVSSPHSPSGRCEANGHSSSR